MTYLLKIVERKKKNTDNFINDNKSYFFQPRKKNKKFQHFLMQLKEKQKKHLHTLRRCAYKIHLIVWEYKKKEKKTKKVYKMFFAGATLKVPTTQT